ncbi:uncharacterized protein B0H18DRAFT_1113332 [Fomitopsis serialis]|uniref:uncharacterized protein n=1 Tax=Fomitopsis serialis TaxID=139415 RepID=UPI002008E11C|nr:uncharacterized protein B0H18DRAFT_1113332 [Neoantrodia serialis]KAH9937507.1 hypothetical protein B0H18DRAFT_1113332 [Neoantrodia serialis]
MALQQTVRCPRPLLTTRPILQSCTVRTRHYAQVGPTTFVGKPPAPPDPPTLPGPGPSSKASPSLPSSFDAHILAELRRNAQDHDRHAFGPASTTGSNPGPTARQAQLPELIEQYVDRGGLVLDASLPYESRPTQARRIVFDAEEDAEASVAMIVHVAENGAEHKITYCSGFALSAPKLAEGQALYVTCAHTLEEIRFNPVVRPLLDDVSPDVQPRLFYSLLFAPLRPAPTLRCIVCPPTRAHPPVSPYPAQPGTRIRAHFVTNKPPTSGPDADGWRPWVGGTWSKWVRGTIVGYRDLAGREAKMRNRIEGVSGWGAPSELIFEMFSLPGLKLKNRT